MSVKRLRFDSGAIVDAMEARAWYAEREPSIVEAFLLELDRTLEAIVDSPTRWPNYLHDTKRIRMHRFPFIVVYYESESAIEIVAIAHGSRRPGYWLHRLA